MTLSIWRYSHLALAVSSFLFIALASITGVVLAFEPVNHRIQSYSVSGLNEITLGETVVKLQEQYDEVLELKVENTFVIADVTTKDGDSKQLYIDPKTGQSLGELAPKNETFEWFRTLHRSLFLHGLGRAFMGITAFLLFLIAFTGTILVIRRQRGIKHFFSKVVKDDFWSFYHVIFGRIWLIPILILSLTGVFLTAEGFQWFEEKAVSHHIDYDNLNSEKKVSIAEIQFFNQTKLNDIRSVEFPFSTDVEDPFIIKLYDREIYLNQVTGEILSDQPYGNIAFLKSLSLDLHTGRNSVIWAIVLAIGAINILFFIVSGFGITFSRWKGKIFNKYTKDEAEIIVLVGSENGSTLQFAGVFHQALLEAGKKSYLCELNTYEVYPKSEKIIVFAATYGKGQPPVNATKALSKFTQIRQPLNPKYAVLAFGSVAYEDFCRFGYEVHNGLSQNAELIPFMEIRTVNDKNLETVQSWIKDISAKLEVQLNVNWKKFAQPQKNLQCFVVTSKTKANAGEAFILRMNGKLKKITSGDLLNVFPAGDHRLRQYSIGMVNNQIQLSVKRHENGLGSEFLYQLEPGSLIHADIERNPGFYLDPRATDVVLISNGTGIAPFVGMIAQNASATINLYCGFRDHHSFSPYQNFIETDLASGKLSNLHLALSREGNRQYVHGLLESNRGVLKEKLISGAHFMLCGSLAMQKDVLALLSAIALETGQPISYYQARGQVKTDCY